MKRRTKAIGRFPGETNCLSLCWVVLDLVTAGARGLGLTGIERQQIYALRVHRIQATTVERSAWHRDGPRVYAVVFPAVKGPDKRRR